MIHIRVEHGAKRNTYNKTQYVNECECFISDERTESSFEVIA